MLSCNMGQSERTTHNTVVADKLNRNRAIYLCVCIIKAMYYRLSAVLAKM